MASLTTRCLDQAAFAMTGALMVLALACFGSPARAGVSNAIRHPTSSSIPCPGVLTEHITAGGNVHNVFQSLRLVCEIRGSIFWMLESAVGCAELNTDRNMDGICGGAIGSPIDRFLKEDGGPVNDYALVRYIFAKECRHLAVTTRHMQALTNKISFSSTEDQIVCTDMNVVDGTRGDEGAELPPERFKFVHVKTTGAAAAMSDGSQPSIANVSMEDRVYRLRYRDGKLVTE